MTALARNSFAAIAFVAAIHLPYMLLACMIVLLATSSGSGRMTCGCATFLHPLGVGMNSGGVLGVG
eukprot:631185-Ditylum_brightwellii.AAC.1